MATVCSREVVTVALSAGEDYGCPFALTCTVFHRVCVVPNLAEVHFRLSPPSMSHLSVYSTRPRIVQGYLVSRRQPFTSTIPVSVDHGESAPKLLGEVVRLLIVSLTSTKCEAVALLLYLVQLQKGFIRII